MWINVIYHLSVAGVAALFLPNKDIPVCHGLECMNGGMVNYEVCKCVCNDSFTGPLCGESEKPSSWPDGSYSLPSSVFGCPETDDFGWSFGYLNLTFNQHINRQHFPERFRLLGPYFLWTFQFNFCTRIATENSPEDGAQWPTGSYCIFKPVNESCPKDFRVDNLTLQGYELYVAGMEGHVPDVDVGSRDIVISLCCKHDDDVEAMELPTHFPFYLIQPPGKSYCQPVRDMVVIDEVFSFLRPVDRSQKNPEDIYYNVTFCYYEPYERRECMYSDDKGASYRGRVNVTADGLPCQRWDQNSWPYNNKDYMADFEENHCRVAWKARSGPFCVIDEVYHYCDIPVCDASDDPPNIIHGKVYKSPPTRLDSSLANIADGNHGYPTFSVNRPYNEPWVQIYLQEDYEIHSVTVYKVRDFHPHNNQHLMTFVSRYQWDFLRFGAYVCDGPYNPSRSKVFRFQCRRSQTGSYVTVQNLVYYDPYSNPWKMFFFEASEIVIRGHATGCGKTLGIKTGEVKDFQLKSSSDGSGYYAYHARLNRETGWCSQTGDSNPFMQVDLLVPMVLEAVLIQGWIDIKTVIVNNFTLHTGMRENELTPYLDRHGDVKVFRLQHDVFLSSAQKFLLPRKLLTKLVRLDFHQDTSPVCVKFDLLGCPTKVDWDLRCSNESTALGLQVLPKHSFYQHRYNDSVKITAASQEDCQAYYLRNTDVFSSYRLSGSACTGLVGSRYSRHNQFWWVSGQSAAGQYGQLMCLRDTKIGCGGVINNTGTIYSPLYPFYYGENMYCTWTVMSDPGKFIRLELVDVHLALKEEPYDKRSYFDCEDTLTIVDKSRNGDVVITKRTGYAVNTLEGSRYISTSNEMAVNLMSCHRIRETTARGFAIKIDTTDCSGCGQGWSGCSQRVMCTDRCGYIASMDYPSFYPLSTTCQWKIQGHRGQYVKVTFDMIDIDDVKDCQGDYVSLYDLDLSYQKTLIGKFCKNKKPIGDIKSSWHMMDVEFYSDFEETGRGFLLKYSLETISFVTSSNTSLGCSEGTYAYNHHCYKFITVKKELSWIEAEKNCVMDGGHLVSINTVDEMLFLQSKILTNNLFSEKNMDIYIGLRKTGPRGFEWTDGSPLSHSEWYGGDESTPGQPDGFDRERCTKMTISDIKSTSNWHDVPCAYNQNKQYICETQHGNAEDVPATVIERKSSSIPRLGYYFQCTSTEHISRLYVCDGIDDCRDGSDEYNCSGDVCPPNTFTCTDSSCIDIAFYCDYKHHCADGADERNCVSHNCSSSQWRCHVGQCIDAGQRCDLRPDCVDGSDETDCEVCQDSFFQCYDGQCLPPARVCDGMVDCGGQHREDEDLHCTTNSQPSCMAWHALGATEIGKYSIVMHGTSDTYPVECIFNTEENKVMTIIHHNDEDLTVTGESAYHHELNYTVPDYVISYVMTLSSSCHQYVQFDCLQDYAFYRHHYWYDFKWNKRTFSSENKNCSCILTSSCSETNTKCACDKTRIESIMLDDNEWFTDSGHLDDMTRLPMKLLHVDGQQRLGRVRHFVGPLVCETAASNTTSSVLCENGVVVDAKHLCIMDYDEYGQVTGCRDLSHLQRCADHKCPNDHAKCPSSYCIPQRRVCDGTRDCPDGTDERNCASWLCNGDFRCHGSKICIPWQQVCDGIKQCPEGDDESLCYDDCPEQCTCNGTSIACHDFHSDKIQILPANTRQLELHTPRSDILRNHTFSHMNKLAELDLSNFSIYLLEADCFSSMDNLLSLDLSMNFIKTIPKDLFSDMRNLQRLNLQGNMITNLYSGSFAGLTLLPSLDLSGQFIKTLVAHVFDGLPNLKMLNVSSNKLEVVEDEAFFGANMIQSLDMTNNILTGFTINIFSGLSAMKYLYSDKHMFCCFKPESVLSENCFPQPDEFSSCSDLMRNETLRISMWVLGFLALIGNLLVIFSRCIYDRESLAHSNDLFVANLACSDLLMGLYMIMIASADTLYRGVYSLNEEAWRSSAACQVAGFLASLSTETSVMFLCVITLDRVLAIKFPFKDLRVFKKCLRYSCILVWSLGVVFAGVPLLPAGYFSGSYYSRSGVCLALPLTRDRPPGWEYSAAIFIIWNFVCFLFIALGQAAIYQTVRKSRRMRKGRASNEMTIARKLSFIVITDFVCWFPICVMGLMALRGYVIGSEVYAWVAVFVLPINSALNPVIYTMSSFSTIRQRKIKRKQTISTSRTATSTSVYSVCDQDHARAVVAKLLGNGSLCLTPPPMSSCLSAYQNTCPTLFTMLTAVRQIATSLDRMHTANTVTGRLGAENIHLLFDNKTLRQTSVECVPIVTDCDEDFCKDILDFGNVVSKMLKAYTVSRKLKPPSGAPNY